MGGYLAVPQTQRDHDYINLFLDRALGDPNDLINNGGGVGFESWIGVGVKLTTVGLVQQLTWEAQQCAFFHLCEGRFLIIWKVHIKRGKPKKASKT